MFAQEKVKNRLQQPFVPVSDRGAGGHGKQNQPDKKKTKKTDYTSSNGNQATQAAAELTAVAPLLSQDNKTVATQSQWRLAAAVVRSTHRPSPPYTAPPPPPLPLCYLSVVELKPYTSCHAVALDRQAGRYRRPRTSSHFGTTNRPRHQVGPEHAAAAARCPPTARWNNPTPFIRVRLQLHLSSLCASAVAVLCRYDAAAAAVPARHARCSVIKSRSGCMLTVNLPRRVANYAL